MRGSSTTRIAMICWLQRRGRWLSRVLAWGALATAIVAPLRADIVWIEGEAQPLFGLVESQGDTQLLFRQRVSAGQYELREFDRSQVRVLVPTIDRDRMGALNPESPLGYRDVAEGLLPYAHDPESRDWAVRLFTIAGFLADQRGDGDVRDSAIRNLLTLARTPQERRRVERMARAYGLETSRDRSLASAGADLNRAPWLRLVRAIRREQWPLADELLARLTSEQEPEFAIDAVTTIRVQDLRAVVEKRSIEMAQLDWLLRLELWLGGTDRIAMKAGDMPWNVLAGRTPLFDWVPDWDELNEFDPRQCVFRENDWTFPAHQPR